MAVEKTNLASLNDVFIRGRVNPLSNIIIAGPKKEEYTRALALLYRFQSLNDEEARGYYRRETKVGDF